MFTSPLAQLLITSTFGTRVHPNTGAVQFHDGVDFRAAVGTPVYASDAGVVSVVNNDASNACGKYIKIDHPSGLRTLYCHLNDVYVSTGEQIAKGAAIARSGNTGGVVAHLHFRVQQYINGVWKAVNPVDHLPGPIPLKSGGFAGTTAVGIGLGGLLFFGLLGYFVYEQVRK